VITRRSIAIVASAVANIVIAVYGAVNVDGEARMALALGGGPLEGLYPASLVADLRRPLTLTLQS
jgi:hypothetical protein